MNGSLVLNVLALVALIAYAGYQLGYKSGMDKVLRAIDGRIVSAVMMRPPEFSSDTTSPTKHDTIH